MDALPAQFRTPRFRRWFLAGVLGRLTAAMAPIALLIVGSQVYDSVGIGARLAAVASISAALIAPLQGRRLDRAGTARGLKRALWQSTAMGVAMSAGVHWQVPAPGIDVMAGGLGFSLAVIPAGFRALLGDVVGPEDLNRASQVDAVGFEVSLIAAPAVAAAVSATGHPAAMFLLGAVLTGVAAGLVPFPAVERRRHGAGRWGPIPAPRVLGAALMLGIAGGMLEPAVFARVEQLGRPESVAAALLAVIGVGSAVGGLAASARPPPATSLTAATLLTLHGMAVLGSGFGAHPLVLGTWLFAAGAPIAPLTALGATLLDHRVAPERRSVAFALAGSAIALGTGAGQAWAGVVISTGASFILFAGSAAIAVATAAAILAARMRG